MSARKSTEEFIKELKVKQPDIEIIGEYSGSRSYVKVRCLKCGHEWMSMATNLLGGKGCPNCAKAIRGKKRTKNFASFKEEYLAKNKDIEIIGEYKNTTTKVKARCLRCGHEWDANPSVLLRGGGCPRCAHTGTSYAEQIILLSLQDLLGEKKVLSRNRNTIGKELDIYIPSLNVAIEYGAWPWHKGKELKDKEKYELCKTKGIRLIQIFDAYDGKEIDNCDFWTYKENIGHEYNSHLIREIVERICKELGIPFSISDDEYENIKEEARLNSRRLTRESLQKKVSLISPNITIIGEYKDSLTKLEVKCEKCGHKWKVIPASLLRGLGCPVCANKSRSEKHTKTRQDVLKDVQARFPNVDIIGDYTNTHSATNFICYKCGNTWTSSVHSVLAGNGCPKCKEIAQHIKKDKEFKEEIKKRNPDIEFISEFLDYKTPITVKCLKCGTVWNSKPANLMAGNGCNACAIKRNADRRRKTQEQFEKELYAINPNIEVLGKYISNNKKIHVRCKKCLREWGVQPSSLLAGNGCAACSGNKKKTQEEFEIEISKKFPSISVLSPYINAKTSILFRCEKCGKTWKTFPDNILHGKGCPECSRQENARKRRKTHDQFINELSAINKDVEIIGTYQNSHSAITAKCKNCGNVWNAIPYKLLNGIGCPKCAAEKNISNMRKTHEQFVSELRQLNPNLEVLGKYKNAKTNIHLRCLCCGHEWDVSPDTILHRASCPACRKKEIKKDLL